MPIAPDSAQAAESNHIPDRLANPPAIVEVVNDLSNTSFGGYISRLFENLPEKYDPSLPASYYNGKILGSGGFVYDGNANLKNVSAIIPKNGKALKSDLPLIYINGMDTGVKEALTEAQCWADTSCYPVVCIYHAKADDGAHADVLQAIFDKLEIGQNKAVDTLSDIMINAANTGSKLHLAASSRGAIVISRALDETYNCFAAEGDSPENIQQSLSSFDIETTGGASHSFRSGPRFVHYVCRQDPIPFYFGLTTHNLSPEEIGRIEQGLAKPEWVDKITDQLQIVNVPMFTRKDPGGETSIIITFDMPTPEYWIDTHVVASYLNHRLPFEEAFK